MSQSEVREAPGRLNEGGVKREGLLGATETSELSREVVIGKEKLIFPIELAGSPVATYLETQRKLIEDEKAKALAEIDPQNQTLDRAQVELANQKIDEEVRNWKIITEFLQRNAGFVQMIDETGPMRFPGEGMAGEMAHTQTVREYFAQKKIPTEGVEKYFLTTVKDVAEFEELERAGLVGNLRVKRLYSSLGEGEKNTGVEIQLHNSRGESTNFVFIFADVPKKETARPGDVERDRAVA